MSTTLIATDAGPADDLLLKVTPPRVPRHLVIRSRLLSGNESLRDHPVILVQAPARFGWAMPSGFRAFAARCGRKPCGAPRR